MAGGDGAGASGAVNVGDEEASSFVAFAEVGGLGGYNFVAPGEAAVVETLQEQDDVCYCVVDC
jgi:hypothetical protein